MIQKYEQKSLYCFHIINGRLTEDLHEESENVLFLFAIEVNVFCFDHQQHLQPSSSLPNLLHSHSLFSLPLLHPGLALGPAQVQLVLEYAAPTFSDFLHWPMGWVLRMLLRGSLCYLGISCRHLGMSPTGRSCCWR